MKTYLDCIPCFFKQALEASRLAGVDEETQKSILDEVSRVLPDISMHVSPPETARTIYGIIGRYCGMEDPYRSIKKNSNEKALLLYDRLVEKVNRSERPLLTAVELAIAGNIIDYGVKNTLNVEEELERIINEEERTIHQEPEKTFNFSKFKAAVQHADTILYLGDNAGETVFDRILIEEIKKTNSSVHIVYAVKEKPIINDALREDAVACGLDDVAEIVSSGSDVPGTVLSRCTEDFLTLFNTADVVISKGQGNYEALSGVDRPVFFLFMAKCPVVAGHVGCELRDIILEHFPGKEA